MRLEPKLHDSMSVWKRKPWCVVWSVWDLHTTPEKIFTTPQSFINGLFRRHLQGKKSRFKVKMGNYGQKNDVSPFFGSHFCVSNPNVTVRYAFERGDLGALNEVCEIFVRSLKKFYHDSKFRHWFFQAPFTRVKTTFPGENDQIWSKKRRNALCYLAFMRLEPKLPDSMCVWKRRPWRIIWSVWDFRTIPEKLFTAPQSFINDFFRHHLQGKKSRFKVKMAKYGQKTTYLLFSVRISAFRTQTSRFDVRWKEDTLVHRIKCVRPLYDLWKNLSRLKVSTLLLSGTFYKGKSHVSRWKWPTMVKKTT